VAGISQPLWTGGKLTAELDMARSSANAAEFSVKETQLSLAKQVIGAYQSLMQAHLAVRAQKAGNFLLEKYAATMERRVLSGASALSDQEQVYSRLSAAQSDLTAYQTKEQAALVRLGQLVGHPLEVEDITFESQETLPDFAESDTLIAHALSIHPTLNRLRADLKTAEHQVEYQQSTLMPTFNLKAEHRRDLFPRDAEDEYYGEESLVYLVLDYAPGAGLSAFANIESARAKTKSTQLLSEAFRRELTAEVQQDYTDYRSSASRLGLMQKNVRTTRQVLESYDRLFVVGKRSWLDVLNAARELTQGELIAGDMRALYQASAYRLRLHAGDMHWLKHKEQ
jgi:outer membrane protein, adhesin transport system